MILFLPNRENSARQTNLAVSSTEFCQEICDEGDIREGLGDGCGN